MAQQSSEEAKQRAEEERKRREAREQGPILQNSVSAKKISKKCSYSFF
jgi:hypothetical protein